MSFALSSQLFLSLLSVILTCPAAHASYTVSSLPNTKIDFLARTHIILSGKGNDLGRLPLLTSLAKGKRISEVYPGDQVVIINTQEISDEDQDSIVENSGFQIARSEKKLLDSMTLVNELVLFKQIASFNFFGHSGIEPGMFLDGLGDNDLKWRPISTLSSRLRGHFTEDAYAILNGCNQGHLEAPILSKAWGIPVAGTLTSSHFEQLYNNGKFYWADDNLRKFFAPHSESTLRMKPDDVIYEGYYGRYDSGLAFFKFFCVGMTDSVCLGGMRASVFSLVGIIPLTLKSPREDYLKVVREWLCPAQQYGSQAQEICIARLASINDNISDKIYSPFRGPALSCDFNSCYVQTCFASAEAMTNCAKAKMPEAKPSTSFVDEYQMYERAY